MAKRQSAFDLDKYVVMGIRAELEVLQAAQRTLEAQLAQFTRGRNVSTGTKSRAAAPRPAQPTARKRTMSAEARKRIGDAQRARWAKQKENAAAGSGNAGSRKKR